MSKARWLYSFYLMGHRIFNETAGKGYWAWALALALALAWIDWVSSGSCSECGCSVTERYYPNRYWTIDCVYLVH